VRTEVSSKSQEWGYQLGSVYIRKVHFRDIGMITGPEVAGVGIVRPNITPRGRTVVEDYDSSITTYNARTG